MKITHQFLLLFTTGTCFGLFEYTTIQVSAAGATTISSTSGVGEKKHKSEHNFLVSSSSSPAATFVRGLIKFLKYYSRPQSFLF
jgi:hypothetical protein